MFGGRPTAIIKSNVIKGNNNALGPGGGILLGNGSDALIVQNLITGNQTGLDGGGISALSVNSVLVNNTIADNTARSNNGSGVAGSGVAANGLQLINNIIVAKPGQSALFCYSTGDPITRFNNIFSARGPAYGGACSDRTGTDGNISADPQFIAPTQGDYHLHQVSPSIDSGDNLAPNLPDKDLDGHPRILDGSGKGTAIVDMGVYEFLPPPSAVWNFIPRRPRSFTAKSVF
jgi:hypothetical protein